MLQQVSVDVTELYFCKTTGRDFLAHLARKLGGWMPQNYSMLTHVKTGGKKNSTLCATTFGFFIPNLGIWIPGSGLRDTCHRCLFFKFLEDKDQKIEDWFDPHPNSAIQPKARGYSI